MILNINSKFSEDSFQNPWKIEKLDKMDSEDSVGSSNNGKMNVVDLNNYDRIKIIGRGASSDVYLIIDKKTGKKFTAKVARYTKEDDIGFIRQLVSEYEILSSLNSPFVIKSAGFSFNGFKDNPCPALITEYYQYGDLLKMIEKKALDETQKFKIIYGIAIGMSYIHSKNIIHRNLKPSKK